MGLFISIQFTEPMINALEAFQSRLKASGVEGYFTVRENLHLTLAFIGDYGALELCNFLFEGSDLILLHIYSTESEVDLLNV